MSAKALSTQGYKATERINDAIAALRTHACVEGLTGREPTVKPGKKKLTKRKQRIYPEWNGYKSNLPLRGYCESDRWLTSEKVKEYNDDAMLPVGFDRKRGQGEFVNPILQDRTWVSRPVPSPRRKCIPNCFPQTLLSSGFDSSLINKHGEPEDNKRGNKLVAEAKLASEQARAKYGSAQPIEGSKICAVRTPPPSCPADLPPRSESLPELSRSRHRSNQLKTSHRKTGSRAGYRPSDSAEGYGVGIAEMRHRGSQQAKANTSLPAIEPPTFRSERSVLRSQRARQLQQDLEEDRMIEAIKKKERERLIADKHAKNVLTGMGFAPGIYTSLSGMA